MDCHSLKTGNVFVTESFPEYTISCFFTACSGEKNNEVIANVLDTYAVFLIFTFWVLSLETSNLLYSTLFYIQRATKLSVKDKKNIQLVGGPLSIYLGQTHQNFSSCIRY